MKMRSLLAPLTFNSSILFFLFSSVSLILIFLVTRILQCSACERPATMYLSMKHYLAAAVASHSILLHRLHFFEYFRINPNKTFASFLHLQNAMHKFINLWNLQAYWLFLYFSFQNLNFYITTTQPDYMSYLDPITNGAYLLP
jgi:hypothetical protein